jgi:hypothetical protein
MIVNSRRASRVAPESGNAGAPEPGSLGRGAGMIAPRPARIQCHETDGRKRPPFLMMFAAGLLMVFFIRQPGSRSG